MFVATWFLFFLTILFFLQVESNRVKRELKKLQKDLPDAIEVICTKLEMCRTLKDVCKEECLNQRCKFFVLLYSTVTV